MKFLLLFEWDDPIISRPFHTFLVNVQDELVKQKQRVEDVQKQNKMLHEQMEQLSAKMAAAIQEQAARDSGILNVSFNEEDKTQEQVLEILRWMSYLVLQCVFLLCGVYFDLICIW